MANIITAEYFAKQPIQLTQVRTNAGIPAGVQNADTQKLNDSIAIYEPLFLEHLLGKTLAAAYAAAPQSELLKPLSDILYDSTTKKSTIAKFIYFWYLNDFCMSYNGETFRQSKSDGSVNISVVAKQVHIWSLMKEELVPAFAWLSENSASLTDLDVTGWSKLLVNYNSAGL